MPPRREVRRHMPRDSKSPAAGPPPIDDESTLWPDEGSDTDPEYIPTDSETESDSDSEDDASDMDTETETDTDESEYSDSDSE